MAECRFHVERVKLSELKLDMSNLRGHDESELALLERSLTIFGQFKPLYVDSRTMQVKIGNGRLMAMRRMGWTECDCVLLDWDAYKGMEVMDNRLNDMSTWSEKPLDDWLFDKGIDWWGLDSRMEKKVSSIIRRRERQKTRKDDGRQEQPQASGAETPVCPKCGKPLVKKERIILD